jgi:hypothetical protein
MSIQSWTIADPSFRFGTELPETPQNPPEKWKYPQIPPRKKLSKYLDNQIELW